jgi:hypothetical protein
MFEQLNILVFISSVVASIEMKEAVSDYGNLKTLLCLNVLLLPLMLSNWGLALLTVNDFLEGVYAAYYILAVITSIVVFVGYCIINRRVRFSLRMTWWKLAGKEIAGEESLSVTRVSLASRNAFASPFEVHRPPRSLGVTSSSTTSRSTTTKGSSAQYYDHRHHHHHGHRRRHKRRHCKHRYRPSSMSESNPSLELASSHSSDCDEGNSVAPTQNEINSAIQRNLHSSWVRESQEDIANQQIQDNLQGQGSLEEVNPYATFASRPGIRSNILAMGEEVETNLSPIEPLYSSSRSSSSKVNNNRMTETSTSYLDRRAMGLVASEIDNLYLEVNEQKVPATQSQSKNQEDNHHEETGGIEEETVASAQQDSSSSDRQEERRQESGNEGTNRMHAREASSIISALTLIPPLTSADLTASDSD